MLALEIGELREVDFDLDLIGLDNDKIESILNPPELTQDVLQGGDQGNTPADNLESYENSTVRQIVLIMDVKDFDKTIDCLEKIKKSGSFESNTEAALMAIQEYANNLPE
jgi:hypothetical protein